MRNRASALLLLATASWLISASCPAQTPAPSASPSAPPNTIFHSDALVLDFAYPSNFQKPKGTDDVPEKAGAGKSDSGCASVPLAVMDMSTGFNMIFLKRYDPSCRKDGAAFDLKDQATDSLRDSLSGFGRPTLGAPVPYVVAGHEAATVFGRVKLSRGIGTKEIFGAAGCVVSGKSIACFEFLSDDCRKVAILSASPVKFAGTGVVPVLPGRLVPACKPIAVQP